MKTAAAEINRPTPAVSRKATTNMSPEEKNILEELQRDCPRLEVVSAYTSKGWHLIGYRHSNETQSPVQPERVIEIKGAFLKPTGNKFREAYAKAKDAGLLKPDLNPEAK